MVWKVETWVDHPNTDLEGDFEIVDFFFTEEEAHNFAAEQDNVSLSSEEEVNVEIEFRLKMVEKLEKEIEHLRSFL